MDKFLAQTIDVRPKLLLSFTESRRQSGVQVVYCLQECAAKLPALYEIAFHDALGEKYAALEQDIWREIAKMVQDIARTSSFPTGNAREIAQAARNAMIILFGPEYGGEVMEVSRDGAVILVKRCPFLVHSSTLANDHERTFSRCMALTLTAVPLLNKEYTARFVRALCNGDRQCEVKIEKKPPAGKTGEMPGTKK